MRQSSAALQGPHERDDLDNLLRLADMVGEHPSISFFELTDANGKRRTIGNPNEPLRRLHKLFGQYLEEGIQAMGGENDTLIKLPSSRAFVRESNPLKNALEHQKGRFSYVTDFKEAYPSLDLERLAALIVYIKKRHLYRVDMTLRTLGQSRRAVEWLQEDPLYPQVHAFLESFCSGLYGKGLAIGGPLSPYLFNLYCEVYVDANLRDLCKPYGITFTRYADDNVFTRDKPIISDIRREIRRCINQGGFAVNHRKSFVRSRQMGTIHITKLGMREMPGDQEKPGKGILVFPKKKRRALHGLIASYFRMSMDEPKKVAGLIGEFVYYLRNVETPTKTDLKTIALCKAFEEERAKHGE